MPPKGKKATSKTPKPPRESPDSQTEDDLMHSVPQRPGENLTIEISDDSASSDQDEQQARESFQKTLQEIQGDLTKSYVAKRKQFHQDIKSTIEFHNKKLLCVFKTEQMERQMLHAKYTQMFEPLFQQWERDVLKTEQEEHSFVNAANQHAEILNKCAMAQKTTIDEAKKISDQFLKSIKVLEDNHKRLDAIEQKTVNKEIENLKMKLQTENVNTIVIPVMTNTTSLRRRKKKEKSRRTKKHMMKSAQIQQTAAPENPVKKNRKKRMKKESFLNVTKFRFSTSEKSNKVSSPMSLSSLSSSDISPYEFSIAHSSSKRDCVM